MSLCIADPEILKRRDRQADHAPRLVDLAGPMPAVYREDAVRIQSFEEDPPSLQGIEPVLGQRERASSGGRPGVDQAHLDDVEGSTGAGKPAPRLINREGDPGLARDNCVVCEAAREEIDKDRFDLNADYFGETKQPGGEHIPPATNADHRACSKTGDRVGQVRYVVS